MARTFNPPPNWPKPPEGWQPPPGWQPDPAWGPAPEGWELWVEDSAPGEASDSSTGAQPSSDQTSGAADATGGIGAGAAAGAATGGSPSAPSFGGQNAGTGTSRMPQYQGSDAPTSQQAVNSPEPTVQDHNSGQYAAHQSPQYSPQGGGAAAPYQAAGAGNVPPNSGAPSSGNGGGSKLPWILGAVIALLLVVLLVLVLALSGVFGGNGEQTSDDQTQSQTEDTGGDVEPGSMGTAAPGGGATAGDTPSVSEEATRLNVDPEGATEVSNPTDPVETFTQDDGEIELPRPDGDDAPQLISVTTKNGDYVTFEAERKDGSDGYVSGGYGSTETFQLIDTYSFDRGNPVVKVWTEDDDVEFELKVYSLDDLTNVDGGSIKGSGDAVFTVDVKDGSTWYKMSHNGTSNFIVHASADYEDGTYGNKELAANEIGRSVIYTEYGQGKWLVSVDADGKWGFEESTEKLAREAAVAEIMNN
ncbi:hypothetical protein [Kocuria sp.]|uniref:hypothetical protein n=1 Tax=Kocuria sp. TaxID=1871328 RepID=UPI0026E0C425|nr:hypothetical protein [Kocuria sp.]MDO5619187.1 hypothetical protein [Kocuria sp.]